MCGIVAYISPKKNGLSHAEMEVFEHMLFVDTMRGWDSTGVFGVRNNGNVSIHKAALMAPEFIRTNEFKQFRTEMISNGSFVVGHNRAATRGAVNDKNAHPFWVDDRIVVVQNGTWRGDHKKVKDTEVDTEAVAHILADNEDIEEAINKIDAAYALVWYDVKKRQLNAIRNDDRPLYIGKTKDGGIILCSETLMIQYATMRVTASSLLEEKPVQLAKDTLLQFTLDTDDKSWKQSSKEIKIRPKVFQGHSGGRGVYGYDEETGEIHDFKSWAERHGMYRTPKPGGRVFPMLPGPKNEESAQLASESFPAIAMRTRKDLWLDSGVANKVYQAHKPEEVVYIILEDYLPANEHKNCSVFYVYGKSSRDDMLYYWIERDKTEDEILKLATAENAMYMVKPSSPTKMEFLVNGDEKKGVVACYAMQRTKVTLKDQNVH